MRAKAIVFAAFLSLFAPAWADSVNPLLPAPATYANTSGLLTDSNNFTVPPGVTKLLVALQGGGGGGGGIAAAAATGQGGTSGEYLLALYNVTPGQIIAYTNGAGGSGGAAGNNAGANGASATFGTITVSGGLGGGGAASGNGTGYTATQNLALRHGFAPSATVQLIGSAFQGGAAGATGVGGIGGVSLWSPPASGTLNSAGTNATGYGGGGSGAGSSAAASALAGGNGAPSAIQVWW